MLPPQRDNFSYLCRACITHFEIYFLYNMSAILSLKQYDVQCILFSPLGCAPPPTRYAPKTDSQIKGIVSYEKQTTARFDAGKFHSENEGGRMPRVKLKFLIL